MTSLRGSEQALAKLIFVIAVCAGYASIAAAILYVVRHTGGA